MDTLNELNELVNNKFENRKTDVYQEFRVLVKINAKTSEEIRKLLDKTAENLGKVDTVVEVTPN